MPSTSALVLALLAWAFAACTDSNFASASRGGKAAEARSGSDGTDALGGQNPKGRDDNGDDDGQAADADSGSESDSDDNSDSGQDGDEDDLDNDYETPRDDVLAPIDSACALGGSAVKNPPVAPASSGLARIVPDSCRRGIEFNNMKRASFRLVASKASTKKIPLEIDVASYTAEDRMRLIAETEDGDEVVMDTCRLRTATYADPTAGLTRPPAETIREFRLKLPIGTTALRFDWQEATTPTYIRVIGLCRFNLTPSAVQGGAPALRPVTD